MSVLLLSGGLDSAVCLALSKPDHALFVDYGQPHLVEERDCATRLSAHAGVELTRARISVRMEINRDDATMLVPGRNLILISLAATLGTPVVIGCNADDYAVYLDCRPEFFGVLRPIVKVETPLIGMSKVQIGEMARSLGVGETWSCYYPQDGQPCGGCDACLGRDRALA